MTESGHGIRVDARAKAAAKTKFIEDITVPGMLHGATVRSELPHARIKGLQNREELLQQPGVVAVLDFKDIPGYNVVPFVKQDYPCLAEHTVRFTGEAVALIAAETREEARSAALKAEISYEPLPAIYEITEALMPDTVHVGGDENIHASFKIRKGSVEKAFKEAFVTAEATFSNKHQVHCYLENQGMLAVPEANGGLKLTGSMQCPFYVHNAVVKVSGLPYSKIRVVQSPTGGGFGGKEDMPSVLACHAALMALKTGRPVSLIYDREEDFISMSKRHPARTRIKYAADSSGKITACEAEYLVNGGAYCTLSPIVAWRGLIHIAGCYEIENVKVDSYAVATNTVPCGAFRGFGQPQVNFAGEILIDELAEKLDMSPLELRKKNLLKPGSITATDQVISDSCGLEETLDKSVEKIKFKQHKASDKGRYKKGMGISTTFYGVGLGAEGKYFAKAGAQVHIKEDASVIVAVGNVEMGQGAETVFNRIVSEVLGCSRSKVEILSPDTTRVPDSGPTVASRATMIGGRAVMEAAKKIKATLCSIAAEEFGIGESDNIVLKNGHYVYSDKSISYEELVSKAYQRRERTAEQGWYRLEGVSFDEDTGLGDVYPVYTFSTNICEVVVDTYTGEVKVNSFVAAHDIGKAIHPPSAEGQIQGGTVQAIGYALYENLCLEAGRIVNPSLTGYTIPTSLDCCDINTIIVEKPYEQGPFGAKGLGEPPMVGPAAAIFNAIYDAIGIRFRSTPCLPEDIVYELTKESSK